VCRVEDKVKLWDVKQGICIPFRIHRLMHTGTLLHIMVFTTPHVALFFNQSPNNLVVACRDGVFICYLSTQSILPFSDTPPESTYEPHALAFSVDDTVLVAGCENDKISNACGYDTATRTRLWIYNTIESVGAVCMLGAHVLVTVFNEPTLVLVLMTGIKKAEMQAHGGHFGLGMIEGLLCFFLTFSHPLRPQHFHLSRHAAASSLQTSQGSAFAAGDVGLDCKVSSVASIVVCF
jgi:WD40 repeat protein